MKAPRYKVLIIGGGFSGMAATIQLRKINIAVDLVELDKNWRSYGAGITISGPSLRAPGELGVLDSIVEQGWCADGCDVHMADGTFISQLPTPRIAGMDVPGGGAIMRPVLAKILSKATLDSGTQVRLGCTFTDIQQADNKVQVAFTDQTSAEYDLVIGADGVFSTVRQTLFPSAPKPFYTGQGVWRAVVPRGGVPHTAMFLGKQNKTGVNPVSGDEMYLFLNNVRPELTFVKDDQAVPMLKELLEEFTAPLLKEAIATLKPHSKVIYRPLEGMLMPLPWATGNVLLIGDAVHATTPTWLQARASVSRMALSLPMSYPRPAAWPRTRKLPGAALRALPSGGRKLDTPGRNRNGRGSQARARRSHARGHEGPAATYLRTPPSRRSTAQ
jgi:2-polyprenyl-6-methoxyphenol hydroxylase-like FAD-dependent oxidoreductase